MTTGVVRGSLSFIVGQLMLGGAEKQLYILVRELTSRGWRVQVISLNMGHDEYWEEPMRRLGVRLDGLAAGSPLGRVPEIAALLRATRPMIVHSWSEFANPYAAVCGRLAGVRIRAGCQQTNERYIVKSRGRVGYALSFCALSGVSTNSRSALAELGRRFPRLRVGYVPNALDPVRVTERSVARTQLGLTDDVLLVGAVGALVGAKRFDLLIDAVGMLRREGVACQLALVGDGPLHSWLYNRARTALGPSGFRGLGERVDVPEILSALDVFVLSSEDEGTPNVLLEAMSLGIPVVATAVGGVPDIVIDGRSGLLVEPGSPRRLADAIRQLLLDRSLAVALGVEGRVLVTREFSTDKMVAALFDFYADLGGRVGQEPNRNADAEMSCGGRHRCHVRSYRRT
jgi:glycosyltransferase involved in cell wall biosynthesis